MICQLSTLAIYFGEVLGSSRFSTNFNSRNLRKPGCAYIKYIKHSLYYRFKILGINCCINPFIKFPFKSICQLSFESGVLAIQTANRIDPRYNLSNPRIIIDRPNIVRILCCLVELINHFNFTISEVLEANINKLKVRYGDKLEFTQDNALNRDLDKEKIALT